MVYISSEAILCKPPASIEVLFLMLDGEALFQSRNEHTCAPIKCDVINPHLAYVWHTHE